MTGERLSVGVPASPETWQPIETAPRDGTAIFGRTYTGFTLVAHWEEGGFMLDDEQEVGSWVAEYQDEHPDDWTDGACWASNENGDPSDPLVAFISLAGIASDVAGASVYRPGTENYARVYQGAYSAAKRSFRSIAVLEEQTPGTPRSSDDGEVDKATVDAVLAAVERRSVPTMDASWSAGWNSAMDSVSKAIIETRAAIAAQVTK